MMPDTMMTFPDTIEEFMEIYKQVDTEQIYSNGTEYVPIYRIKQWINHNNAFVKHGHWIVDKSGYPSIICSECSVKIPMMAGWCMDAHINYCPNCGVKMNNTPTEKVDIPTENTNRPTDEVKE